MWGVDLALLFLLLLCSAWFSLTESAVTALSVLRMKKLTLSSPRLGPVFQEWLTKPHRFLTVLMVGNNAVNIAFSSLAAVAVSPLMNHFPRAAVNLGVWLLVTGVLLVFGEIVPKIVGRVYRERVAVWSLPLITRGARVFFWILGPVGWVLDKWVPSLSQAPVNQLTVVSLEELQHAVEQSQESGHLSSDSGDMFRRTLAFHGQTAGDLAHPLDSLDTLPLESLEGPGGWDLFLDLLVEKGRTRVPVTREKRLVGYVNTRDFISSTLTQSFPELDKILRPLHRVTSTTGASDLLDYFKRTGDSIVLVESPEDTLGFLTMEDLLEEIVGDILDEYDREDVDLHP